MQLFLKHGDGSLRRVEVYADNIINLVTGTVEESQFVAHIWVDNGEDYYPEDFHVEVNPGMTIKDLKDRIERRTRIPPGLQTLIHNKEELEMKQTLMHYKMCDGVVHIDLLVRELLPTSDSDKGSDSS